MCKNLLGDGLNFPQKLLFSLLWMVKIINSFTGSFLSLAQDFFSVMGVIDVSELVQLEAYTILINMALEIALFLFFEVIFGNLNISNTIAMGQLGIICMFFVLFLI